MVSGQAYESHPLSDSMKVDAAQKKSLPQALLCDLDDTILDDTSGREPAWSQATIWASGQVVGLDSHQLFKSVIRTADWYWSKPSRHKAGRIDPNQASTTIVDIALKELGFNHPNLAGGVANTYHNIRSQTYRPFPGAIKALRDLRAHGVRLGLITNGGASIQRGKLERLNLAVYFDHIHIEGEYGYGKPDPRVYQGAMASLKTGPNSTWCVGDNLEWEVAAPQRLGIYSIWMDFARRGLPTCPTFDPDRIIHSFGDLLS